MRSFVPKKTIPILLILIFVGIILVILQSKLKSQNSNQTNPIKPGKSSFQDIYSQQTEPFLVDQNKDSTDYYVGQQESSNYTVYHTQDGTVEYFIVKNPTEFKFGTLSEYVSTYGNFDTELFGPWSDSGFKSYVFLNPGLVIVAHPISQTITEEWHIPEQLTYDVFISKFRNMFFTTKPSRQNNF